MTDLTLTISLLGNTYPIKCAADQQAALQEAAAFLTAQLEQLSPPPHTSKSKEALLVLTALNMAHACLQAKHQLDQHVKQQTPQLQRLIDKLDVFLAQPAEMRV